MSPPFTPKRLDVSLSPIALDAAVRELFGLSWGRARDLIGRGKVAVEGRVSTSPTLRVKGGSEISIDLAARAPKPESLAPDAIVFADAHVVIVEKPAGISTVPFDPEGMGASIARRAQAGDEVTLDQRVRTALRIRDLGIVHRLDKETTGLIVFTRSWAAKKGLTQAFRFHHVKRRYLAIVHGAPRDGTIVTHFVEDRGDGLRGSVEHRRGRKHAVGSEKTQRAVTHVRVVERLDGFSLVECRLETGRTHQIRIHLAEAGHPVLGERVYIRGYPGPILPAPRVMLHAAELGFVHPATGEEVLWSSDLPADMVEMLKR